MKQIINSRTRRIILSFLLALVLVCNITPMTAYAADDAPRDISAFIKVEDFQLQDTNLNITLDTRTDLSTNSDDYSNMTKGDLNGRITIKCKSELPAGMTLRTGDYFTITMVRDSVYANHPTVSDWTDLKDSDGNVIGTWRITQASADVYNIEGILNETVDGNGYLGDLSLTTNPKNFHFGMTKAIYTYPTLQIGEVKKSYKMDIVNIKTYRDSKKMADKSSDHTVTWYAIMDTALMCELWESGGTSAENIRKNYYYEDFYKDALTVDMNRVEACFRAPLVAVGGENNGGTSERAIDNYNITKRFTAITPSEGMSYAEFKAEILAKPLSYGFFTVEGGVHFVLNAGDYGDNGIRISEVNSDYASRMAGKIILGGFGLEEDRADIEDWIRKSYGDGNAVNGNVPAIVIYTNATYEKVAVDTKIENTDSNVWDGGGKQNSATATLSGLSGDITADPFSVVVMKYDTERGNLISGASFKIQFNNKGVWEDYIPADGGDRERLTDENGMVSFRNLGLGQYRIVETAAAEHYDLSQTEGFSEADGVAYVQGFEITADSATGGYVYKIKNTKLKYKVIYNVMGDPVYGTPDGGSAPEDESAPYDYKAEVTVKNNLTTTWTTSDGTADGTPGTWTFSGWDRTDFVITEDTTITGSWAFTPDTTDDGTEESTEESTEKSTEESTEESTEKSEEETRETSSEETSPEESESETEGTQDDTSDQTTLETSENETEGSETSESIPDREKAPITGDRSRPMLWAVLLILSLCGAVFIIRKMKHSSCSEKL